MRLFIAINFNKKTKSNITAVQNNLKLHSKGNFTLPDNMHLTLVFLGDISSDKIDAIKQAMNHIHIEQFSIQFSHTGFFKRNDGDIWWIGLKKNTVLMKLQKDLCASLVKKGFSIEERSFKPHITLARKVSINKPIDKNELLYHPFETEVHYISLMKSERINSKLTYTEIYRCP